jgi:hypothetical protein
VIFLCREWVFAPLRTDSHAQVAKARKITVGQRDQNSRARGAPGLYSASGAMPPVTGSADPARQEEDDSQRESPGG